MPSLAPLRSAEFSSVRRLLPGGLPVEHATSPFDGLDTPGLNLRSFAPTRSVAEPGSTTRGRLEVARVREVQLTEDQGARTLVDHEMFERLARRDNSPGAMQVQEMKFFITGIDTRSPKVYFLNTNNIEYHWFFARDVLKYRGTYEEFEASTYWFDSRKNLAGSILFHESYEHPDGKKGLYTMEFWPTDPVKANNVAKAYSAVKRAMPFAAQDLLYHPAGNTQEMLFHDEEALLRRKRVKTILSDELFENLTYSPMNLGEGWGYLRVIDGQAAQRPPTARDVCLFTSTPNDLSHVAGIITENPQTPLSHINLKAKQNKTPNAYIKDARNDPKIKELLEKGVREGRDIPVHYQVTPDGFKIDEIDSDEVLRQFERLRPPNVQFPPRKLEIQRITPLDDVHFGQADTFGAKATNVAELRRLFPDGNPLGISVPDGWAMPFHFYHRFMEANGFYDEVRRIKALPDFDKDADLRDSELEKLREKIENAPMPADLAAEIGEIQEAFYAKFGAGRSIRCRSSTNNEDLPKFNGAGLYDSFTHKAEEGHLEKTIKDVFASMWNFRAFEEREFYRVDHFTAAMGVLIHPNEKKEQANIVAYTKNIYDPKWPGFYFNAQVGEALVTNPPPGTTPDEFLVSAIGRNGEYETQYISHSSLIDRGKTVLAEDQVDRFVPAMERIQAHFKRLYERSNDETFGMDIEAKVRSDGSLQIKQARPTVD
jgi:pyruvate, water dikinase